MENIIKKVNRGEIYYYNFGTNEGSIQNGFRPVLVIQGDKGNEASPTTIVAAMTTAFKKKYLPTHIYLGERFGLSKPSMVMLEQLRTVNQEDLLENVGCVNDAYLIRMIGNAIKKGLGLWNYEPKNKNEVRCLCPACLESYKYTPNLIVRRLDPYARVKEKCDRCDGYGYDYIVYENKKGEDGGKNV